MVGQWCWRRRKGRMRREEYKAGGWGLKSVPVTVAVGLEDLCMAVSTRALGCLDYWRRYLWPLVACVQLKLVDRVFLSAWLMDDQSTLGKGMKETRRDCLTADYICE
jgi:hypothetical protein